jgi:hypothetical protein
MPMKPSVICLLGAPSAAHNREGKINGAVPAKAAIFRNLRRFNERHVFILGVGFVFCFVSLTVFYIESWKRLDFLEYSRNEQCVMSTKEDTILIPSPEVPVRIGRRHCGNGSQPNYASGQQRYQNSI